MEAKLSWFHTLPNTTPITPFRLIPFPFLYFNCPSVSAVADRTRGKDPGLQIIKATSSHQDLSCKKENSQLRVSAAGNFSFGGINLVGGPTVQPTRMSKPASLATSSCRYQAAHSCPRK